MPLWPHKCGMPILRADEAASKGIAHVSGKVIATPTIRIASHPLSLRRA
ncbi:hypothetical protein [Phenylobacterium sp.]